MKCTFMSDWRITVCWVVPYRSGCSREVAKMEPFLGHLCPAQCASDWLVGLVKGDPRESADTFSYYDVKNILVKCYAIAMIVHSVAFMKFRPKGNGNSRSKCAYEVETIQLGGKPL